MFSKTPREHAPSSFTSTLKAYHFGKLSEDGGSRKKKLGLVLLLLLFVCLLFVF